MRVLKQELKISDASQVLENAKALLFAEIIDGKLFIWFEEDITKSANICNFKLVVSLTPLFHRLPPWLLHVILFYHDKTMGNIP